MATQRVTQRVTHWVTLGATHQVTLQVTHGATHWVTQQVTQGATHGATHWVALWVTDQVTHRVTLGDSDQVTHRAAATHSRPYPGGDTLRAAGTDRAPAALPHRRLLGGFARGTAGKDRARAPPATLTQPLGADTLPADRGAGTPGLSQHGVWPRVPGRCSGKARRAPSEAGSRRMNEAVAKLQFS